MKKSLKKAILTCAATSALFVAMAVSANAATYDVETNTVSLDNPLEATGKQVTVLILDKDAIDTNVKAEDILYINQEAATADSFMAMPVKALADGTYTVKVGGEALGEIITETFTVGEDDPDVKLGDVNDDGELDGRDALEIMRHDVGLITLTEAQKNVADVNSDDEVDGRDALEIMRYDVGLPSVFEDMDIWKN